MKILLVSPETPSTFWAFKNAIKFISKKSSEPPLGLLTIAAMLPEKWPKKLIDMNVSSLTDEDIVWADYLFITGMNIHKDSFKKTVQRANEFNTPVVAGGPMVTTDHGEFEGVDHFILNEAEITLPQFLNDLETKNPKHIYSSTKFPDLSRTPVPLWHLLEQKKYASMSVQYSRGCPYNCEFCSITMLNGHRPRTKDTDQFLSELEAIYKNGWQGHIFIVDDNFIGNKNKIKKELLPAIIKWSEKHNHPFYFSAEVSIDLSDDEKLLELMVKAGFESVFVGIETPNDESLAECGKTQNRKRSLEMSVKKIHKSGIRVSAGFIIGFDNDPPDIFEKQIELIRNSAVVTAMVGLLNAPTGTRLFKRLKKENRLLNITSGNNMDGTMNFIPKMNYNILVDGYKKVLETIYSHKEYYERVKLFLKEFRLPAKNPVKILPHDIRALFKSIWILGIQEKGKRYYWELFFSTLFKHPKQFPLAVTLAIYGFHFRQVVKNL